MIHSKGGLGVLKVPRHSSRLALGQLQWRVLACLLHPSRGVRQLKIVKG